MSNKQKQDQTKPSAKKPFMLGYTVRPIGDGRKSSWNRIAAAWEHKDGQGFEVRMDALPVDGRLVLRTVTDDRQPEAEMIDQTPE